MRSTVLISILSLSMGSLAHAREHSTGTERPGAGDWQLFLDAPPAVNGINLGTSVVRGFGVTLGGNNGPAFGLGLTGGVGYAITDLFEIGGGLGVAYSSINSGTYAFGMEPFAKLNLGRAMIGAQSGFAGHLNPYVMGGISVGVVGASSLSSAALSFDVSLGVEAMIAGRWGLQVFLPLSVGLIGPNSGFGFGLGYGMVAYF